MNLALRKTWVRDPLISVMNDIVNDVFSPYSVSANDGPVAVKARVDVVDRADRFEIVAELPGVKKQDIRVNVDGPRTLKIEADARLERDVKDGEAVLHTERFAAQYVRTLTLPADLDASRTGAKFEDGLLTLTVAKRNAPQPVRIAIE